MRPTQLGCFGSESPHAPEALVWFVRLARRMGALADWLGAGEAGMLRATRLGRLPYATPDRARPAVPSCDWSGLDALLSAQPPDVLVVAHGRDLPLRPPRSLLELRQLFARGIGVAVRKPESHSQPLAALSEAFARDIPGEQRVIVFATPGGHSGFGWHYDAEDVFIVQTEGDKEYFFRRNTVTERVGRDEPLDFSRYHAERSPHMSCRLLPGDLLYLPRGYWHVARAHADAVSISIGVFPSH
jgi:50S ribosomal protein L16 3-hydroxylase